MRILICVIFGLYLLCHGSPLLQLGNVPVAYGAVVVVPPVVVDADDNNDRVEAQRGQADDRIQAQRAGGGYRSPRGGFTPGAGRDGTGRNPGAANPGNRAPGAPPTARPGGFFGGLFGGLLAGSLLGSLLNPFGFGGTGVSLLGLLVWAVILYFGFRLIRRAMRGAGS